MDNLLKFYMAIKYFYLSYLDKVIIWNYSSEIYYLWVIKMNN